MIERGGPGSSGVRRSRRDGRTSARAPRRTPDREWRDPAARGRTNSPELERSLIVQALEATDATRIEREVAARLRPRDTLRYRLEKFDIEY
ncbi:MAG: hypothetical protein R3E53_15170 [Myxococcota bacterium]